MRVKATVSTAYDESMGPLLVKKFISHGGKVKATGIVIEAVFENNIDRFWCMNLSQWFPERAFTVKREPDNQPAVVERWKGGSKIAEHRYPYPGKIRGQPDIDVAVINDPSDPFWDTRRYGEAVYAKRCDSCWASTSLRIPVYPLTREAFYEADKKAEGIRVLCGKCAA